MEEEEGYNTDDTVLEKYSDEYSPPKKRTRNDCDELMQINDKLNIKIRQLTTNLETMPSPPPTVKTARNGDYLYIYEKVNNLYTRPGQMYEGDLYDFRLLTTDDGTNVLVYDSNGNEIPTKKLEFGGKRRRTTHRKARKRGGNKKSCKRTKKR